MLQGDEIRACWQAPSRPEPYEGLFRELEPEDPAGGVAPGARAPSSRDGDLVGTRTWAIPILPDRPVVTTGGASGLREATFVPARTAAHRSAAGAQEPGSDDPELGGIGELPAVGEGDPDGHHSLISDRTLDETHL